MRGTWQTTGGAGSFAWLSCLVVAAVVAVAVVRAVARIIWWLTGAFAAVVICGAVLAIVVRRSYARGYAEMAAARDAQRIATQTTRPVTSSAPREIHHHENLHIHGPSAADVAAILEARRNEGQR